MPRTEAQNEWRRAQRKEHGGSHVRIDTTPVTKAEWKAYADSKGLPLGTMIRECIARCMQQDNWTYQPPLEEETKE